MPALRHRTGLRRKDLLVFSKCRNDTLEPADYKNSLGPYQAMQGKKDRVRVQNICQPIRPAGKTCLYLFHILLSRQTGKFPDLFLKEKCPC